jgi:hypothetical protein
MKAGLPILFVLLFYAVPGPAGAQEFGRLFFTPQQRAALDARRTDRVPDKPSAPVVASPTTRLDGYVQRSGGRSTLWVNGESLPEASPEAPRFDPARNSVSVTVGESGARVRLKPGEVLDRGTGEVRDVIGEGRLHVDPGGR